MEYRERNRPRKGRVCESCSRRPERGLKSFICQLSLVDPPDSCIPSSWISVCGSSEGHGGDLALDIQFEALVEFDNQGLGVHVSGVQGQDQETVQEIVYHPVSLIVRGLFQSIDNIRLHINRKELTPELLFEIGPESNKKDTSVHLLVKEVLRPSCGLSLFEEGKGPEDFLLVIAELLWGQVQIESAGVEEGPTGTSFPREVWGKGEFWPCSLFRWSVQNQRRGANRRRRCRCWRRSDGWSRSRAGHELNELL